MVKFRHYCLTLFTFCLVAVCEATDGSERRAVIDVAQKYVGVKETGQNNGVPYQLFMKPYGFKPGTLWCALFANHVFREAAVKHGVGYPALAVNWSVPPQTIVWKWGQPVAGKIPLEGDLALYKFDSKRINHIEIVYFWDDDDDEETFWVIGGNTSNPQNKNQEGVYLKRRLKREAMIVNRIDYFNKTKPELDNS